MTYYNVNKSKRFYPTKSTTDYGIIGVFESHLDAVRFIKKDADENHGCKPYKINDDYYSVHDKTYDLVNYFYEIYEDEQEEDEDIHPDDDRWR